MAASSSGNVIAGQGSNAGTFRTAFVGCETIDRAKVYLIKVEKNGSTWLIGKTFVQFEELDRQIQTTHVATTSGATLPALGTTRRRVSFSYIAEVSAASTSVSSGSSGGSGSGSGSGSAIVDSSPPTHIFHERYFALSRYLTSCVKHGQVGRSAALDSFLSSDVLRDLPKIDEWLVAAPLLWRAQKRGTVRKLHLGKWKELHLVLVLDTLFKCSNPLDLNPNGMFELRGAKAIKISLADCPVQKHNVSTSTRTENSDVNGDPSSISIANGDRDSASGKEKEKEKGKNEEREKERDKSKSKVKENKKEKEKEARRKEKEKDRVRMEDGERVWENCFSVVWHDAARHFAVATQSELDSWIDALNSAAVGHSFASSGSIIKNGFFGLPPSQIRFTPRTDYRISGTSSSSSSSTSSSSSSTSQPSSSSTSLKTSRSSSTLRSSSSHSSNNNTNSSNSNNSNNNSSNHNSNSNSGSTPLPRSSSSSSTTSNPSSSSRAVDNSPAVKFFDELLGFLLEKGSGREDLFFEPPDPEHAWSLENAGILDLSRVSDARKVGGLLLQFLRHTSQPLIPHEFHDVIASILKLPQERSRQKILKAVMQSLPLINERLLRLLVGFLDLFFRSLASSSSSSSSSSSNSKNSSHSNSNSNKANAKSESKQNPGSTFNYAPTLRAFANAIMRTDNCSCYSAPPSPPSTSPSTSPSPSTSTSTLTSMSTIVPGSAVSTLVASATSTFATVTGSPAVASVAAIGAMNRAVASKLLFCLLRHRNYLWRYESDFGSVARSRFRNARFTIEDPTNEPPPKPAQPQPDEISPSEQNVTRERSATFNFFSEMAAGVGTMLTQVPLQPSASTTETATSSSSSSTTNSGPPASSSIPTSSNATPSASPSHHSSPSQIPATSFSSPSHSATTSSSLHSSSGGSPASSSPPLHLPRTHVAMGGGKFGSPRRAFSVYSEASNNAAGLSEEAREAAMARARLQVMKGRADRRHRPTVLNNSAFISASQIQTVSGSSASASTGSSPQAPSSSPSSSSSPSPSSTSPQPSSSSPQSTDPMTMGMISPRPSYVRNDRPKSAMIMEGIEIERLRRTGAIGNSISVDDLRQQRKRSEVSKSGAVGHREAEVRRVDRDGTSGSGGGGGGRREMEKTERKQMKERSNSSRERGKDRDKEKKKDRDREKRRDKEKDRDRDREKKGEDKEKRRLRNASEPTMSAANEKVGSPSSSPASSTGSQSDNQRRRSRRGQSCYSVSSKLHEITPLKLGSVVATIDYQKPVTTTSNSIAIVGREGGGGGSPKIETKEAQSSSSPTANVATAVPTTMTRSADSQVVKSPSGTVRAQRSVSWRDLPSDERPGSRSPSTLSSPASRGDTATHVEDATRNEKKDKEKDKEGGKQDKHSSDEIEMSKSEELSRYTQATQVRTRRASNDNSADPQPAADQHAKDDNKSPKKKSKSRTAIPKASSANNLPRQSVGHRARDDQPLLSWPQSMMTSNNSDEPTIPEVVYDLDMEYVEFSSSDDDDDIESSTTSESHDSSTASAKSPYVKRQSSSDPFEGVDAFELEQFDYDDVVVPDDDDQFDSEYEYDEDEGVIRKVVRKVNSGGGADVEGESGDSEDRSNNEHPASSSSGHELRRAKSNEELRTSKRLLEKLGGSDPSLMSFALFEEMKRSRVFRRHQKQLAAQERKKHNANHNNSANNNNATAASNIQQPAAD